MARTTSERLRRSLVADIRARGVLSSALVEASFLAVAREHFVPEVLADGGLNAVYRDDAIVTKRNGQGLPLSSSSQPSLMAKMLELLDVRPGVHVLEIGAGTGYNAALLAHITGPSGRVTSIDIDPDLARRARRSLRDAGTHATIITGDGREGHPSNAPYDRIPRARRARAHAAHRDRRSRWDPESVAKAAERGRPARATPPLGPRARSDPADSGARAPPRSAALGRAHLGRVHAAARRRRWMDPTPIDPQRVPQHQRPIHRPCLPQRSGSQPTLKSGSPPPARLHPDRVRQTAKARPDRPCQQSAAIAAPSPAAQHPGKATTVPQPAGRWGVGIVDRRSQSAAIVSLRSPWDIGDKTPERRARWRLDTYGADTAAAELDELLTQWRELEHAGQTKLRITARGRASTLRLTFAWAESYA